MYVSNCFPQIRNNKLREMSSKKSWPKKLFAHVTNKNLKNKLPLQKVTKQFGTEKSRCIKVNN